MRIHSPQITGSAANTNIILTTVTSSISVLSSSFADTASYWSGSIINAASASYWSGSIINAASASYVLNAVSSSYAATSSYANSFTVGGTITAQTLVVQTITSSVDFVTGSSVNGSLLTNTHQFTGSVSITSSAAALLSVNNDILYVSSSGNIGIGVTSISPISTYKTLEIRGATGGGIKIGKTGFSPLNIQHDGTDAYINNVANGSFNIYTNDAPRLYISSSGNVGIGTSSPGYKLHVDGTGYFSSNLSSGGTISGGSISTSGTTSGATLVVNSAIHTYNVQQYYYGSCFTFTPPNMLNSNSYNSEMRIYLVWVIGVNGYTEAGLRVWLVAINGGGTAYNANELLGRDANGGTGLSISRSSATQLQICSNNNAFIKFVSIMQLNAF